MDRVQKTARAFIQKALRMTGLEPTVLARKAGVAPSTINKPLRGDETYAPALRTIVKIGDVAGIDVLAALMSAEIDSNGIDDLADSLAGTLTVLEEENLIISASRTAELAVHVYEEVRREEMSGDTGAIFKLAANILRLEFRRRGSSGGNEKTRRGDTEKSNTRTRQ